MIKQKVEKVGRRHSINCRLASIISPRLHPVQTVRRSKKKNKKCASQGTFSGVCFRSHRFQIKSFLFTSFSMDWHLGSGGHENTVKPHKKDESHFHLKE